MQSNKPRAKRNTAPWRIALPFQGLVFLGSFLLFQVELILARLLLPVFGSSASVWTTCLMFYQGILFLGYLYAGRANRWMGGGGYRWSHLFLVLFPVLWFPFKIHTFDLVPVVAIILSLTITLAVPFFALSTTSIIAQGWLTQTKHPHSGDPYFLYAASNMGALGALVTYPFLVEPTLTMDQQLLGWYGGYGIFVLLHLACIGQVSRAADQRTDAPAPSDECGEGTHPRVHAEGSERVPIAAGPSRWQRLHWMLLAGGANALLMAVTNVVTMDAPVPLLWVFPLMIYLATLIAAFARTPPGPSVVGRIGFASLFGIVLALIAVAIDLHAQLAFVVLHGLILLIGCLLAHTQLVRNRPTDTQHLGSFYLHMSLGGWLGSVLITVVMPLLFSWLADHIVDYLAAAALILGAFLVHDRARWGAFTRRHPVKAGALGLLSLTFVGLIATGIWMGASSNVTAARTFYGLYRVRDNEGLRWLQHGNTIHGVEDLSQPGEPQAYFWRGSPIGRLLSADLGFHRVGIVGLGVGNLAAYQQPDQVWDYHELDPKVEQIARHHFTFLEGSRGPIKVIVGDARLTLAQIPDRTYDLLVLDTFSSDFVPIHLVTREALSLYLQKLKPKGLLVFHITNRIFDLEPILSRLGLEVGLKGLVAGKNTNTSRELKRGQFPSRWFVFARDEVLEKRLVEELGWQRSRMSAEIQAQRVWSDGYVNIFQAVRW